MTVQAPVSTSHAPAPAQVPVAERQASSTRGVKVLVSGVVAVLAAVAVLVVLGQADRWHQDGPDLGRRYRADRRRGYCWPA